MGTTTTTKKAQIECKLTEGCLSPCWTAAYGADGAPVWRCDNCGKERPRRVRRAKLAACKRCSLVCLLKFHSC